MVLENTMAFLNEFWPSVVLGLMVITTIFFIALMRKIMDKQAKKKALVSKKNIIKIEIPVGIILIILTTQIIINKFLQDYTETSQVVDAIIGTLIIIALTYLLMVLTSIIIDQWGQRLSNLRKDDTHEEVVPLAKSVTNIVLIIIAIFFLFHLWNIQIGGLLASLGIAGVILGFAFQDTLKNMFAGLALISDNSFRKGDLIELPDGELGYVLEINLRSTKIKNLGSQQVVIPNSHLASMRIRNYALPTKITRIRIDLSIDKNADLYKAEKIILNYIKNKKDILRYPSPRVLYEKISPFSADLYVAVYISDYSNMYAVRSDLIKELQKELKKKGIKLAYPVTEISFMDKNKFNPNP